MNVEITSKQSARLDTMRDLRKFLGSLFTQWMDLGGPIWSRHGIINSTNELILVRSIDSNPLILLRQLMHLVILAADMFEIRVLIPAL
jgi:hypothetical protein